MEEQQRIDSYKTSIDKLRFIIETYVFAIAVIEGKRATVRHNPNQHPLETLFISSYDIDNALEVLRNGNSIIGRQLKYYKEIKEALDTKSADIIDKKYSRDEVNTLLLDFIKKRVNDYDHYVQYLYPAYDYFTGEMLSRRSSIARLLHSLQTRGIATSSLVNRLRELDTLLKKNVDISHFGNDTEETAVLEFAPSREWWWYKENYH